MKIRKIGTTAKIRDNVRLVIPYSLRDHEQPSTIEFGHRSEGEKDGRGASHISNALKSMAQNKSEAIEA